MDRFGIGGRRHNVRFRYFVAALLLHSQRAFECITDMDKFKGRHVFSSKKWYLDITTTDEWMELWEHHVGESTERGLFGILVEQTKQLMRNFWIIGEFEIVKYDAKQKHMERMEKYFREYKEQVRIFAVVDSSMEWQYARINEPARYKFLQEQFNEKMKRRPRR